MRLYVLSTGGLDDEHPPPQHPAAISIPVSRNNPSPDRMPER
jgi:hypothetical protein